MHHLSMSKEKVERERLDQSRERPRTGRGQLPGQCWENGFWSENFSFLGANDTDFRMQRVERAEDPLAEYLYFSCGIRFGAVF